MKAALIGVSLCALTMGLIAPRTAIRSAHALVAVLAVALLIVVIQPTLTRWEISRARPFARADRETSQAIAPVVIHEIVQEIVPPNRVISPRLRTRMTTIALGRLLDHHHTFPSASTDDVGTLSPTLRAIIDEDADAEQISLRELDSLLTELEQL